MCVGRLVVYIFEYFLPLLPMKCVRENFYFATRYRFDRYFTKMYQNLHKNCPAYTNITISMS